jgi:hypothetical protein
VLERHLLRDQIISSDAHELGKFRGEPVYSRSQVLHLKAAENWMRHGRVVRAGEQPLKYVKQRAVTVNRRRELEIRADAEGANGSGDVMQGLYSEAQTERYIPPPVIDVRPSFTPPWFCEEQGIDLFDKCRERFRRTISGTSISTRRLCFLLELRTSHVRHFRLFLRTPCRRSVASV